MQLVEKAHHAYGTRSTCFGWQRVTLSALQILPLNAWCCGDELHSRNHTALLLLSERSFLFGVFWVSYNFNTDLAWFSYITSNFTNSIGDWNQIYPSYPIYKTLQLVSWKRFHNKPLCYLLTLYSQSWGRPKLNVVLAV